MKIDNQETISIEVRMPSGCSFLWKDLFDDLKNTKLTFTDEAGRSITYKVNNPDDLRNAENGTELFGLLRNGEVFQGMFMQFIEDENQVIYQSANPKFPLVLGVPLTDIFGWVDLNKPI